MGSIESVLFDMDGVVVDSMEQHADAWIRVLGEQGHVLDCIDIYRREGMSGRDSIIDIFHDKGAACPGDEEMARLIEKKLSLFDYDAVRLFPAVEGMLRYLRSRNVSLALVTGSLRSSVLRVLPGSIISLFGSIITADDVARGKPHPEPYLAAMERLGALGKKTVAVENAPQGIRSARGAGIECLAVGTTLPEEYLAGASRIFKNHGELMDYFRSVLS